jgi:hypothetical protein
MEFAYDGGGIGRGGTITLYVDGDQAAEGRVERTHLFIFSMDETTEIGNDAAAADADHLIAPEERFRIAMAKQ